MELSEPEFEKKIFALIKQLSFGPLNLNETTTRKRNVKFDFLKETSNIQRRICSKSQLHQKSIN